MRNLSSATPQIGAALAAALMIASALAFQAGSRSDGIDEGHTNELLSVPAADFPLMVERVFEDEAAISRSKPEPVIVSASTPILVQRPRLAIIIDDVADYQLARQIWSMAEPLTVSVLPYAEDARTIAEAAGDNEVFMHLPMEPVGLQDPGLYALTSAMPGESLSARVKWALERVPGAVGFNNHMGSRLTADRDAMDNVFRALDGYQDQLIFVDSLTHPNSIASDAAIAAGFVARDRDVFLDHEPGLEAIDRQLNRALERAIETGTAIAIGHPRPQTLEVLQSLSERAEAAGVDIVPVRDLIEI